MNNKTRNSWVSVGSVVALLAGFILGIFYKRFTGDLVFIEWARFIGILWVIILLIVVIPLTSSYLVDVVLSIRKTSTLGKISGTAFLVHTLIFLFGMLFSVIVSFALFELLGENLPRLSTAYNISAIDSGNTDMAFHISSMLGKAGSVQKQLGKFFLIFLLGTVLVSFLMSKFPEQSVKKIQQFSRQISKTTMHALHWYLLTLPLAVFCLIFPIASDSGFTLVGIVGFNILVLSLMLIVFMAFLYLLVWLKGNVNIKQFARGMFQPQLVAASTRSSLATIPSLLDVSQSEFNIPKSVSGTIIPFFISVFRMNRAISSPFHYIFLAYVYRLEVDLMNLLIFLGLQVIISFGSPGIPSSGKMTNLPLYLAAGIPLEGYVLMKAVDTIPDIFKTVLNVTQVMTVISVVGKKWNWTKALIE